MGSYSETGWKREENWEGERRGNFFNLLKSSALLVPVLPTPFVAAAAAAAKALSSQRMGRCSCRSLR